MSTTLPVEQMSTVPEGLTVAVGCGFTVTETTEDVALQPVLVVMVTLYDPVLLAEYDVDVAPLCAVLDLYH